MIAVQAQVSNQQNESDAQDLLVRSIGNPFLPAARYARATSPPQHADTGYSAEGRVSPFPYSALIRDHVEKGRVPAARQLLEFALGQGLASPDLERWRRILAPPRVVRGKASSSQTDRSREFAWLDAEGHAYRGKWVAIEGARLVATADTFKSLLVQLEGMEPRPNSLVHRID
jgi:hypothetical protein